MDIRILGPIEVRIGEEPVSLAGPRQRTLLALLATNANEVVSADRLIEDLWSGEPPETARKSVQVYVSRLRKLLTEAGETPLVTRPPGYVLAVDPDQLDSLRFRRLAREGRRLLDREPGPASERLREALALWRGPALHDLAGEIALAPEIARLEEERITALEDRIEADLALGRHVELVGELDGLTRLFPLRERLIGQLMLALYRGGRQAEAIRVYEATRERFAEELGLDPAPELQGLELRILTHDPGLEVEAAPADPAGAGPVMRGYEVRDRLDADPWGERYLAYQTATGTEVVVKVVKPSLANHPDFVRRFEPEAHRVANLAGSGIVPLTDHWRDELGAYLVSARQPGPTLAERMSGGGLTAAEMNRVSDRISAILTDAHAQGVIHGNLASSKIVLRPDGEVLLSDFGLVHDVVLGASPTPGGDLESLAGLIQGLRGRVGRPDGQPAPPERSPDRRASIRNPYKGLRTFGESHAADFFGRDELLDQLVGRLSRPGIGGRLVAVVGPSGSGKSSLVRAGLLAAVRAGRIPGSDGWFVARLTPGDHPFEQLEAALLRVAVNPPVSLLDQLLDGPAGIHRAVSRALPSDESELLLVIDQFEELYTAAAQGLADAFLDGLATALSERRSRMRLVVTVRSDFSERPLAHPLFGELLRSGTVVVGPMSSQDLDRAIVGPASRVGVTVEPAVVAEIRADVAGRPGSLPLLQYALTELFDRRSGNALTLEEYREIGGVGGALVRRAEHLFEGLGDPEQAATEQIFLRLVALDEGGEVTRRRVATSELLGIRAHRAAIERVLDRFGSARLLTFDRDRATRGPTVEVAHEALIDSWGRLRSWIDRATADLSRHRRLAGLTQEWTASGEDDQYLLSGPRLEELETWSGDSRVTFTDAERAFLAASVAQRTALERAELERLSHERQLERRSAARLRMLVAVMTAASVVALLLTLVALDRGADARRQGARAGAVGLSAASVANAEIDPQLGLGLALEAASVAGEAGLPLPAETETALHLALQAARIPYPAVEAPIAAVAAPGGIRGIYRMPVADLVDLASSGLTRPMTIEECRIYAGTDSCSFDGEVADLDVGSGDEDLLEPLAGTTVTLLTGYDGLLLDAVAAGLRPLEAASGIEMEYESRPDDFERVLSDRLTSGSVPDLLLVPQPARIPELAAEGQLVEIGRYLDAEAIASGYAPYLRSLHTVSDDGTWPSDHGGFLGVPVHLTNKSLVWYSPRAFADAGYEVPSTWTELMALSDRMVADGNVPWCMGEESGNADGWPATDWLESILLGAAGPDVYDRWVRHEIAFDDPEVAEATRLMDRLYFTEGYVQGGARAITERPFDVAGLPLFESPPGCWLHRYSSEVDAVYPAQVRIGVDVASFPLPAFDAGAPGATMGGGGTILVFRDRPEVRAVVRHLASPEWGVEWAADPSYPAFGPANLGFDLDHYADDVHRAHAGQIQEAMRSGVFRFDASDLMPPEVGAGTFWAGMIDHLLAGPASADQILARIDASWPEGP